LEKQFQATPLEGNRKKTIPQIRKASKWHPALSLLGLTPEKAELVGALMGDKGTFKQQQRHGFYHGYDLSRYTRCTISICLGKDKTWGEHMGRLMMDSYGTHGSTYLDGNEWRFWSSSTIAFHDLSQYYDPSWNCHLWRVTRPILEAPPVVKERVARGYFDADGYPNFSKARNQVSVKATSVNKQGVDSMKQLLVTIGYRPGVYRRYNDMDVWELCIGRADDVIRFYNRIGFSIKRKQQKLRRFLLKKGLKFNA